MLQEENKASKKESQENKNEGRESFRNFEKFPARLHHLPHFSAVHFHHFHQSRKLALVDLAACGTVVLVKDSLGGWKRGFGSIFEGFNQM